MEDLKPNKWGLDRFALEEAIMQARQTEEDIRLLSEAFYDGDTIYTPDKQMNALMGLAEIAEARNDKLWVVFCKLFGLDNY